MISTIALAVLSHLAPLTPDAFYVAPHDAVLVAPVASDPACTPKDPDKDYRLWVSQEWSLACYTTYHTTFLFAKVTYWDVIGQCAPLDCACYTAAWKELLRIMEQAENDLRHCSPT